MGWIQKLTSPRPNGVSPIIPFKGKSVLLSELPKCAACRFAKATTLPIKMSVMLAILSKRDSLKKEHLRPGLLVSTNQFVSSVCGRLLHTAGKEKDREHYSGRTVNVDGASGLMKVYNQVSLRASKTLQGKHSFKRFARTCGVDVTSYRGDYGVFWSAEYKADLARQNQTILYSGVGVHHQNGAAERNIRTVSESARSMLIHAAIHWPENFSTNFWPFAMEYATYIYNRLPKSPLEHSPIEIFSGTKHNDSWVKQVRVFG